MADEYRRLLISSRAALDRERLLAEAFELGAEGAEEFDVSEDLSLRAWIFAPAAVMPQIRAGMVALEMAPENVSIAQSEALPEVDWSEAWKDGIEALRVSERLVVRPPFVAFDLEAGQQEIVIDPGQAFGTGGHASTQLCLEWVDLLSAERMADSAAAPFARVLDVGTGSGVLAMAAVVLGAGSALGFDLDPLAEEAADKAAIENGLADRTEFLTCPIEDASPGESFPLVLANLLKREILPIASEVAARVPKEGLLILAGLLEEDEAEVIERFAREGLVAVRERRTIQDGTGLWVGLCLGHPAS